MFRAHERLEQIISRGVPPLVVTFTVHAYSFPELLEYFRLFPETTTNPSDFRDSRMTPIKYVDGIPGVGSPLWSSHALPPCCNDVAPTPPRRHCGANGLAKAHLGAAQCRPSIR